jgi:hypothetical protein
MMGASNGSEAAASRGRGSRFTYIEVLTAALLSLAAVMTAWAAFQSTKWSGVQANNYSMASAARVESTRASAEAGQLTVIDVSTFIAWIDALSSEPRAGETTGLEPDGRYTPRAGTASGFFHQRFRDEFRPAVQAWLATNPLTNPAAPRSPFAMPEYQLGATDRSAELEEQAERFAATARAANQNGDNYVLMTILFSMVLFFAGISSKLDQLRLRIALFSAAVVIFATATIIIATFPKEF